MLLLLHGAPLLADVGNEGVNVAGFPDGHARGQLNSRRVFAVLHTLPPAAAAYAHALGDVGFYAKKAVRLVLVMLSNFCWHGWSFVAVAVPKNQNPINPPVPQNRSVVYHQSPVSGRLSRPLGFGSLEGSLCSTTRGLRLFWTTVDPDRQSKNATTFCESKALPVAYRPTSDKRPGENAAHCALTCAECPCLHLLPYSAGAFDAKFYISCDRRKRTAHRQRA